MESPVGPGTERSKCYYTVCRSGTCTNSAHSGLGIHPLLLYPESTLTSQFYPKQENTRGKGICPYRRRQLRVWHVRRRDYPCWLSSPPFSSQGFALSR